MTTDNTAHFAPAGLQVEMQACLSRVRRSAEPGPGTRYSVFIKQLDASLFESTFQIYK